MSEIIHMTNVSIFVDSLASTEVSHGFRIFLKNFTVLYFWSQSEWVFLSIPTTEYCMLFQVFYMIIFFFVVNMYYIYSFEQILLSRLNRASLKKQWWMFKQTHSCHCLSETLLCLTWLHSNSWACINYTFI